MLQNVKINDVKIGGHPEKNEKKEKIENPKVNFLIVFYVFWHKKLVLCAYISFMCVLGVFLTKFFILFLVQIRFGYQT